MRRNNARAHYLRSAVDVFLLQIYYTSCDDLPVRLNSARNSNQLPRPENCICYGFWSERYGLPQNIERRSGGINRTQWAYQK